MNDRTAEEPQDVWDRLTPEQQKGLSAWRSALARKAGRAGTGKSKARTPEQCRKAQKASAAVKMARKRARMAQDALGAPKAA